MSNFKITGGFPLYGSVRIGGAKNASYKLMIASLLADSPSRLLNFSHIGDVALVAQIINSLGAKAELVGDGAYKIDSENLSSWQISSENGEVSRAATLFIPALLAKFGKASVPFPGGDKIGKRPLDRHFEGLEALGAQVKISGDRIEVKGELKGNLYRFKKKSHTGTETLLMAAVRAKGKTVLENAAEETEIDDLIQFLNSMGGRIRRYPGSIIEIDGVSKLTGSIHKIMPDQNQAVSFACAALATKGDVIVEDANAHDLKAFLEKLEQVGAGYEVGHYGIRFFYKQKLKAVDIVTGVHPGFKTDWQPLWVTMMTQAKGTSMVHETVYESRFGYVESLKQMGADIELFNPELSNPDETYNFNLSDVRSNQLHAARIKGPASLQAGEFMVKDLRHGATLMVAGLIARGVTNLHDPEEQINRGYENLDQRLCTMGAKIERY